ncbi:MAG: hypothetical protein IPM55_23950, partial [Acidobacteria bacterium]|nr:hypothetical protein [Acidobacteriota bacterium]
GDRFGPKMERSFYGSSSAEPHLEESWERHGPCGRSSALGFAVDGGGGRPASGVA